MLNMRDYILKLLEIIELKYFNQKRIHLNKGIVQLAR